jgi:hypothetical protein
MGLVGVKVFPGIRESGIHYNPWRKFSAKIIFAKIHWCRG